MLTVQKENKSVENGTNAMADIMIKILKFHIFIASQGSHLTV